MGSAESSQQEDLDPWWNPPSSTNGHNNSNMLGLNTDSAAALNVLDNEETDSQNEREIELGKTIQHLAEENMKLAASKRIIQKKLKNSEIICFRKDKHVESLTLEIETLQKEVASFKEKFAQIEFEKVDAIRKNTKLSEACEVKDLPIDESNSLKKENIQLKEKIEALQKELQERDISEENTSQQVLKHEESIQNLLTENEKLERDESNSNINVVDAIQEAGNGDATSREERVAREIEKFKQELDTKREVRNRIVLAISSQVEKLRSEVSSEKEGRQRAEKQLEELKSREGISRDNYNVYEEVLKNLGLEKEKNEQLISHNIALKKQLSKLENTSKEKSEECEELKKEFAGAKEKSAKHVAALKEVVSVTKHLLTIREKQVKQLETKLDIINSLLESKKAVHCSNESNEASELENNLIIEYRRQIENLKILKQLQSEKLKILTEDKHRLTTESADKSDKLNAALESIKTLEEKVDNLESIIVKRNDDVSALQTQLSGSLDKNISLSNELSLINGLITQMLIGNSTSDIDLDKLTKLLQENHDLISDITTNEDIEKAACLPRLLLDLVCQVSNSNEDDIESETDDATEKTKKDSKEQCSFCRENGEKSECNHHSAAQEIASNLPKVWKILTELLSHHTAPSTSEEIQHSDDCYRSIDTPYGPKLVVSVSKTFLRLKDLILEKKSLRRELSHLKQLNEHLEGKLNEQECRLSLVSTELHKTWSLVSQMRSQHQQLHHHERILCYELQQKRKLLTELKDELEYCREKWEMARQKNSESELEWQKLRKEFAARKQHSHDSFNNSAESGFSDDKGDDDSCEDDYIPANPLRLSNEDLLQTSELQVHDSELSSPVDPLYGPSCSNSISSNIYGPQSEIQGLASNVVDSTDQLEDTDVHSKLPVRTDSTQTVLPSDITEEVCHLDLPLLPEPLHTVSLSTVHNESDVNGSAIQIEYPVETYCGLECSTISLLALLKQKLSYISRNIDQITSDSNTEEALQSIFFLPSIKVPEDQKLDNSVYKTDSKTSFKSNRKKIKCANCSKEIQEEDSEVENSVCKDSHCKLRVQKRKDSAKIPQESISEESIHDDGREEDVEQPSNSGCDDRHSSPTKLPETREERLKRLEEQCQQLVKNVRRTTARSNVLSDRLEELHEHYGSNPPVTEEVLAVCKNIPSPPPMPASLPATRIPLSDCHSLDYSPMKEKVGRFSSAAEKSPETAEECVNLEDFSDPHAILTKKSNEVGCSDESSFRTDLACSLQESKCTSEIPDPPPMPQPSPSNVMVQPVPGSSKTVDRLGRTPEEVLKAREERLRRLEAQCKQLVTKVTKTSNRSIALSNRLEELHEHYGSDEQQPSASSHPQSNGDEICIPLPPPFLSSLPSFRIPTSHSSSSSNAETTDGTCDSDVEHTNSHPEN